MNQNISITQNNKIIETGSGNGNSYADGRVKDHINMQWYQLNIWTKPARELALFYDR